jgi:hypothetical protein
MADENPIGDGQSLDVSKQLLGVAKEIRNILEQMSGLTASVANNTKRIQDSAESLSEDDISRAKALADQAAQLNKQNAQLINISKGTFDIENASGRILGQRGKETVQLLKQNQLFQAIVASLFKNSELVNDFQRELGISYTNSLALRNEFVNVAGATNDIFVNSQKLQKSFFDLKTQAGVLFDITSASSETFLNLTERLGMAGKEAANLTTLFRLQGKDTEATTENIFKSTSAMLQTSKTTATVKDVLGDIATSSKGLQASLAATPGALAKAAIAARELGATLSDMEGIQKSLLDFESSISAELEAELLTGKQLNLEKARTAALNNDLETVGKELGKQGVDLASFGKMNVIQQEKMAAAMGLSRDAMGEMLLKQQIQNLSLDEIKDKFGQQTYEQAKALSAQDKFNAATAKLKDLFVGVMTALTPIIDLIALIVHPIAKIAEGLAYINKLTGGFSNALIGVLVTIKAIRGKGLFGNMITKAIGKTKQLAKGLLGIKDAASNIQFDPRMKGGGRFRDMTTGRLVSNKAAEAAGAVKPGESKGVVGGLKDKVKGMLGGKKEPAPETVKPGVADAAKSTTATPAPKDDGKALKTKMKNIAEGIKAFASTEVIKGAIAMVVASPGLVALGLASIPLKITEKLNGKALQAGMKGIARGVASFGNPMALLGGLALIPISLGLIGLGLGAVGLGAIALLGAAAAAGMTALTGGLIALGTAAATGIPFLGVLLLGAFGAALIPFGFALGLVAPLIEAVGTAIATVIMSIADAVVTVMPALTQGLIDLSNNVNVMGLIGLAAGLTTLGFALPLFAVGTMFLLPALPILSLFTGLIMGLGVAIPQVAAGMELLVPIFATLAPMALGIFQLAGAISALGASLAILSVGAALLTPFLPILTLFAGLGAIGMMMSAAGGEGASPTGGTSVSVAGAGENSGEDMKAMIEETVTATINALVPDMVAALKSGQNNIKVTNDNFNASSQGELPSQMRNISNNNFA